MGDHLERMVTERNELNDKAYKLSQFIDSNPIFGALSNTQQNLMRLQLQAMQFYSSILDMRIDIE